MALPSIKEIKKLAATCRKLGIKTFKSPEFEFTLSESDPVQVTKQNKALVAEDPGKIESDMLSPQDLLFWSSNDPQESEINL